MSTNFNSTYSLVKFIVCIQIRISLTRLLNNIIYISLFTNLNFLIGLEKPLWLTSVTTKGSPDYEVSWDNAKYKNFNRSLPVNYYFTLYWCESELNTPKQCTVC